MEVNACGAMVGKLQGHGEETAAPWWGNCSAMSGGVLVGASVTTAWLFSQDLGYSLFTLASWFSIGFLGI